MNHVLVFAARELHPSQLSEIIDFLDDRGVSFATKPKWLNPKHAAELEVFDKPSPEDWQELKELLAPAKIDAFVMPCENRRKKLLMADMDATIVAGETLDELAAHAGLKEEIAEITARGMRGEVDFYESLNQRVGMLKDLSRDFLQKTLDATQLNAGSDILVKTMAANGATCVLVSGGFTFFTGEIAARAGFHHHHGNILEIENEKLTGNVTLPILDKNAKKKFLHDYTAKHELNPDDTLAIGDGANDLPMLLEAGLGIGYHPKPLVIEEIENCILYTDLTSVLYVQGYTWQEIESGIQS